MANIYRDSSEFLNVGSSQNATFTQVTAQYAVFENAAIDNLNVDQSAVFNTLSANGIQITGLAAGDLLTTASGGNVNGLTIGPSGNILVSTGAAPQWSNTITVNSATTNSLIITGTTTGDLLVMSNTGAANRLAVGASGYFLISNGTEPQWEPLPNPLIVGSEQINGTLQLVNYPNVNLSTDNSGNLLNEQPQFSINGTTTFNTTPTQIYGYATWKFTQGGYYRISLNMIVTGNVSFTGFLQVNSQTIIYFNFPGGAANIFNQYIYNWTAATTSTGTIAITCQSTGGTATIGQFTILVERIATPAIHA